MMNNESGIVNAPYLNAETLKIVPNERAIDGKTHYKCCHCHEWKVWEKMSHNVLLTYPAQYECLDCIKARANSKIDLTIHTIYQDKNINSNDVILGYKGSTECNSGVIFCPYQKPNIFKRIWYKIKHIFKKKTTLKAEECIKK